MTSGAAVAARTYLFVPGDRPDMLATAVGRGADAVIADLEDAVAPTGRDAARHVVAGWLRDTAGASVERWVRVNPGEPQEADVAALCDVPVDGVMLPKVRSLDDVIRLVDALDGVGRRHVKVLPLIETAQAVLHLPAIANGPRVHQLMIGEHDLGAELGIAATADVWLPIRLQVVVASAAAGIHPPLGPVDADFSDLGRLRRETRALYEIGFRSRPAIHPAQIAVYDEALRPSPDEVTWAQHVIATYRATLAVGRGAAVDAEGRMIDEAVVKQAHAVLAAVPPG